MSYDNKCYELAGQFLEDFPTDDLVLADKRANQLAQHIQDAIEEWIEDNITDEEGL